MVNIDDRIDNYLSKLISTIGEENASDYYNLYSDIKNPQLQIIFSALHGIINYRFIVLNRRLDNGHYLAADSRELLECIQHIEGLQRNLSKSELAFDIESYYFSIIQKCKGFLKYNNGSTIPENFNEIDLIEIEPIFILKMQIIIDLTRSPLKYIGQGSYARVFKYKDEQYNKLFAVKRAKSELNEKELLRFKNEFDSMKGLFSPYIAEVYKYEEKNHEYIMEYLDYTLEKYIKKHNDRLQMDERKQICLQIIRALQYIHSKGLLHRDISPTNIMLKKYDDAVVIKITDFGLVKLPDSKLTSYQTEMKGWFNDPELSVIGFNEYGMPHEIYAMTRVIYFIYTGKDIIDLSNDEKLKVFVEKGLNRDTSKRYKNMDEMKEAVLTLYSSK